MHYIKGFDRSIVVGLLNQKFSMHLTSILCLYIYFVNYYTTNKIFTIIILYCQVTMYVVMQYPILQRQFLKLYKIICSFKLYSSFSGKLKSDVVPTLLPNCPNYMSSEPPKERSKTSSASARREQVVEDAERMSKIFLHQDKMTSIYDIYQRIDSDPATPPIVTAIYEAIFFYAYLT